MGWLVGMPHGHLGPRLVAAGLLDLVWLIASPGQHDTPQTPPWWNAGPAPLPSVMWFFIVGGLIVLQFLPAACKLRIRGLAFYESWGQTD